MRRAPQHCSRCSERCITGTAEYTGEKGEAKAASLIVEDRSRLGCRRTTAESRGRRSLRGKGGVALLGNVTCFRTLDYLRCMSGSSAVTCRPPSCGFRYHTRSNGSIGKRSTPTSAAVVTIEYCHWMLVSSTESRARVAYSYTRNGAHEPMVCVRKCNGCTWRQFVAVRGSGPQEMARGCSSLQQWTYLVRKMRYGQVHEKPWHREERRRPEQCEHERKRSPHA